MSLLTNAYGDIDKAPEKYKQKCKRKCKEEWFDKKTNQLNNINLRPTVKFNAWD